MGIEPMYRALQVSGRPSANVHRRSSSLVGALRGCAWNSLDMCSRGVGAGLALRESKRGRFQKRTMERAMKLTGWARRLPALGGKMEEQTRSFLQRPLEPGVCAEPGERGLRPLVLQDLHGSVQEVTKHGVVAFWPGVVGHLPRPDRLHLSTLPLDVAEQSILRCHERTAVGVIVIHSRDASSSR